MRKKKKTANVAGSVLPPRRDERKPEWAVVKFSDLEAWRDKHGIPKKRLAHFLGVTNSTWHNWNRGKAVATYATQRRIKDVISGEPAAEVFSALARPLRHREGSGVASNGASAHDELEAVRIKATGDIVSALIQKAKPLNAANLVEVIRGVRKALA